MVTTATQADLTSAKLASPLDDDAPHILVVDDDKRIRTLLARYLGQNGFRVTVAEDASHARAKLDSLAFDGLVVDVMMPGESGLDFTKVLRETSDVPILMLTARSEADARIKGLELGADDYLAKPFEPRELVLRLTNILRRGSPSQTPLVEMVRFGPFVFHLARGELRRDDEIVRLTDREQSLLRLFAERSGETVPRLELSTDDGQTSERTIDVQINRLRRKIEPDPGNPLYLQTVRGVGYRLVTQ